MRSATPLLEGCRPEGKAAGRPGQAPGWVRGGGTGRAPEDRLDPWRRRPPRWWGMRDGGGVGVGGGKEHRKPTPTGSGRQSLPTTQPCFNFECVGRLSSGQ